MREHPIINVTSLKLVVFFQFRTTPKDASEFRIKILELVLFLDLFELYRLLDFVLLDFQMLPDCWGRVCALLEYWALLELLLYLDPAE